MPSSYDQIMESIDSLRSRTSLPWKDDACGITRQDTSIVALVHPDAYSEKSDRHRVLLLSGLRGSPDDTDAMASALESYAANRKLRNRIALSVIPCANPDGLDSGESPGNGSGGDPTVGYPPEGGYFNHETDPEARYLWRYIGFMAPDFVLEIRASDSVNWECSERPVADIRSARCRTDSRRRRPPERAGLRLPKRPGSDSRAASECATRRGWRTGRKTVGDSRQ